MDRSVRAVLLGTFTLRLSTGLTGSLLVFYLARLHELAPGTPEVRSLVLGVFTALFFAAELVLAPPFGLLSDRYGHHRVMQVGPIFGFVAALATWASTHLVVIGATRILEGGSTAASVPSILGFLAMASAGDELLRGRVSARFEGATLAGLGVGFATGGILWDLFHREAFLVNGVVYVLSFIIYRYGVHEPAEAARLRSEPHPGLVRYLEILSQGHVWLLAPTWIALNAALGLFTSQALFQVVRRPSPRFADQVLMGGFDGAQVSAAFAVGLVVFLAGMLFWGERFRGLRRTTIILYGLAGGGLVVAAAALLNHSRSIGEGLGVLVGGANLALLVQVPAVLGILAGLFVLAGATPAALGLLADITEGFPADRGAIMGLYSVFFAIGQSGGSLVGGLAADRAGFDGILVAAALLMLLALLPLWRLRGYEHLAARGTAGQVELV
jgi:MFS family permease